MKRNSKTDMPLGFLKPNPTVPPDCIVPLSMRSRTVSPATTLEVNKRTAAAVCPLLAYRPHDEAPTSDEPTNSPFSLGFPLVFERVQALKPAPPRLFGTHPPPYPDCAASSCATNTKGGVQPVIWMALTAFEGEPFAQVLTTEKESEFKSNVPEAIVASEDTASGAKKLEVCSLPPTYLSFTGS